jgi:hypothetical protein
MPMPLLRRALSRRAMLAALSLSLVATATACDDDPAGPDEPEPAVVSMLLTFGNGQTATVTGAAGSTPSVRIPVGATTVTARFLRANGTDDPVAVAPTFRLEVVPPAGNITFARSSTNAFSGTLTAATATNTAIPVTFGLFHVEEQHTDFGPFTVNVTVGN